MEALKIFIFEHEIPQADRIKVLLESSGYAVTWAILNEMEAPTRLNQNPNPCSVLTIQVNGKGKEKRLGGIPKAMNQEGVQLRNPTPVPDAFAEEDNPLELSTNDKDFDADKTNISIKVSNSSKTEQGVFPISIQSSPSFILEDSFFIRSNSALVKVKFEDIIYLEADANYTQIFTSGKSYSIRASLKELEDKLKDKRFARVHKSYLINLEKIESIHAESIQINNREIPIGRQQYRWLLGQIKIL